jgi:hypothetical protein
MAHPRKQKRIPQLDQRVLRDPDALGIALSELFAADPGMRRHPRKIIRRQNRLRKLVTDEAWAAYLDLEIATAARLSDAIDLATAWAFRQGRRAR